MPLFQSTDAACVREVLAGRPEAFEALASRYQKKAQAIAHALGVPWSGLDDVTQEAFLQALRDLPSLRTPGSFGPWFTQIVRNVSRKHLAASRAAESAAYPIGLEAVEAGAMEPPEHREVLERVRRCVDRLPDGVREAIFLYYYEGESTCEVARALGISNAAAKKRLQKGRDLLREELWKDLREALTELLPSTREWTVKARGLALLAIGSTHLSFGVRSQAASASAPAAASFGLGVVAMSMKKPATAAAAAVLLVASVVVGVKWVARERAPAPNPPMVALETPRSAPSSPPTAPEVVAADPAPPTPAVAAPAETPRALRVRVVDAAGQAVPGAAVHAEWRFARREEYERFRAGPLKPTLAGLLEHRDGGEFVARVIPTGRVTLTAGAPGYEPKSEERGVPEGGPPDLIDIVLDPAEEVEATLVAPQEGEAPVEGAEVGPLVLDGHAPREGLPKNCRADAEATRLYKLRTDAEGRFLVPRQRSVLWITKDGYGPTLVHVYPNADFTSPQSRTVPIFRPTTLQIRVRDETDGEVGGFRFAVLEGGGRGPEPDEEVRGSEVLHPIYFVHAIGLNGVTANDTYQVRVAGDRTEATQALRVRFGQKNPVNMVLAAGGASLFGSVADADGIPIPGARVLVIDKKHHHYFGDVQSKDYLAEAKANDAGEYEAVLAEAPTYVCALVEIPGQVPKIGDWTRVPRGARVRYDVRLEVASRVVVIAADEWDFPENAQVKLGPGFNSDQKGHVEYVRLAKLDASRRAEFAGIPPGVWAVEGIDPNGHGTRPRNVVVMPGRTYEVVIGGAAPVLGETVDVIGAAVSRGAPAGGVFFALLPQGSTCETNERGAFQFAGVPEGRYGLMVFPSKSRPTVTPCTLPLVVEQGMAPAVVDLSVTTVTGRTVAQAGRGDDPVPGVEVKLFSLQAWQEETRWMASPVVRSDAGGVFQVTEVYPGTHVLHVAKDGFVSRLVEVKTRDEEEVRVPDIALAAARGRGVVRFQLASAGARGDVTSMSCEVRSLDRPEPFTIQWFSPPDPSGAGPEANSLPTGRFKALISWQGGGPPEWANEVVEFDHTAGVDQEIPVRLRPGGAIGLQLHDESGNTPERAWVEVFDEAGQPVVLQDGVTRLRLNGGGEALYGIPLGPLRVRTSIAGRAPFEFPLEAVPGRIARVLKLIPNEN